MKQNFAPNAELGELLALLQETVQVCGKHLTDRVICQCTGMSSKTYTVLKGLRFKPLAVLYSDMFLLGRTYRPKRL